MDRPLRLITEDPPDRLARTLEGLLVVASRPLAVDAGRGGVGRPRARRARPQPSSPALRGGPQRDRARAGRRRLRFASGGAEAAWRPASGSTSGARRRLLCGGARDACGDAYLGPRSRPEIARTGVSADSVVAGLAERGLIVDDSRRDGAVRYRVTPLFERSSGSRASRRLPRPTTRRERGRDPRPAGRNRTHPSRPDGAQTRKLPTSVRTGQRSARRGVLSAGLESGRCSVVRRRHGSGRAHASRTVAHAHTDGQFPLCGRGQRCAGRGVLSAGLESGRCSAVRRRHGSGPRSRPREPLPTPIRMGSFTTGGG